MYQYKETLYVLHNRKIRTEIEVWPVYSAALKRHFQCNKLNIYPQQSIMKVGISKVDQCQAIKKEW